MKITVTLEFADAGEASAALSRLRGTYVEGELMVRPEAVIKPEDRPDAGVDLAPSRPVAAALSTGMPNVGFGVGVTLPPGATPATSTVVAAASPTAPVVPPATSAAAPSVPPVPAAPPAAAAPAPTAPVAPSTPVAGVELDAGGLPWDGRIHASTKTKNKTDGLWRGKRDLDPAVKVAVEAELRAGLAANAAAAPAPAPAPYIAPAVYATPLVPPAAAVPVPPTPAPATAAQPSEWTFASLMERLTPLMMAGTIKPEQVGASLTRHGLQAIGQLAYSPNIVPLVAADLLA